MPSWVGVDPDAFLAGFGIVEIIGATIFIGLLCFLVLRKVWRAGGM